MINYLQLKTAQETMTIACRRLHYINPKEELLFIGSSFFDYNAEYVNDDLYEIIIFVLSYEKTNTIYLLIPQSLMESSHCFCSSNTLSYSFFLGGRSSSSGT